MDEVKNYPPYLDYPKPCKQITNADRIRAMSDEELVEIFRHDLYEYVQYKVNWCSENHMTCTEYLIEWLKQPAEER